MFLLLLLESRYVCRINTAANLSTTALRSIPCISASFIARSAITVVKRSSIKVTGSSVLLRSISANSFVFSHRSPSVLFIFLGYPKTISDTSYCSHSSSIRAKVCLNLFGLSRLIISTPCAVIRSGSETATPTVLDPKSSPNILK